MKYCIDVFRDAHDDLRIYISNEKMKIGEFITVYDAMLFLKTKIENDIKG
jgi:hypothetical protein